MHNSFVMDVPPEKAQEMFVRDIVPDLHRDGRFTMYREGPGEVRLSDANFDGEPAFGRGGAMGALALDLDDIADPDEFEAHDEESSEPVLADVLRRGTDAETPQAGGRAVHSAELLASHRLKVTFAPDREETRVTISGSAHHDVCGGLERLGRPDHWPATADQPHD